MESRNIKNFRIIRALLSRPDGSLSKYRISKQAECSTSWAIEFLGKLEAKKLVRKTKVLNFDKLVDYCIGMIPKIKYFEFYVQDPLKLLTEAEMDYALTTYGAENFTSRHLFLSRYDVYIKKGDFDKWKSLIMKKGLLGKGNLRLIFANDNAIFKESQESKNIKLVSMPQLIIDLKREGGVCVEAYNILVKKNV